MCFPTQSLGDAVRIELDTNKKLMGIAFCVCYGANSSDDEFACAVIFRDVNKEFNYFTSIDAQRIHGRSSKHLWLSYWPSAFYSVCLQNSFYLEFLFIVKGPNKTCCGPCGIWLLYEEDHIQVLETATNLLMMSRTNNNTHVPRGKILRTLLLLLLFPGVILFYFH